MKTFAEYIKENVTKKISWNDLREQEKINIGEEIQNRSSYLKNRISVPELIKNYLVKDNAPIIERTIPINDLMKKVKEKNSYSKHVIDSLTSALRAGEVLPRPLVNGQDFIEGSNRVQAHLVNGDDKINVLDISALLRIDWERFLK